MQFPMEVKRQTERERNVTTAVGEISSVFCYFFLRFSVVMVIGIESAEQVPGGDMVKGETSQGQNIFMIRLFF